MARQPAMARRTTDLPVIRPMALRGIRGAMAPEGIPAWAAPAWAVPAPSLPLVAATFNAYAPAYSRARAAYVSACGRASEKSRRNASRPPGLHAAAPAEVRSGDDAAQLR